VDRRLERIERLSESEGASFERLVAGNLQKVRERVARACAQCGRRPDSVAVLAVTKGFGPEAMAAAVKLELTDIGENYLQEAAAKFAALPATAGAAARLHFIGGLQRNKAKRVAELFDVVQSLDDKSAADALDRAARAASKRLDVLVQVNVVGDKRAGVAFEHVAEFAAHANRYEHLRLRGIMAVGPDDPAQVTAAFARAGRAFDTVRPLCGDDAILSLGMSADLEQAVAAGSTMVRLGTALFGARPPKKVDAPRGEG
jgi:pyridoxal phosphate enzyme (YggS family)